MTEIFRASCRRAALECLELARIATNAETKQILLMRSQEWLKLAYSGHDTDFERLLEEFNSEQMGLFDRMPQQPQQQPPQQQRQQQQQGKLKPKD